MMVDQKKLRYYHAEFLMPAESDTNRSQQLQ